jgi:hypothetical protein
LDPLTALDRLEIIELQSIYAWGIDGRDGSAFSLAFTDDIETEYGYVGRHRGLEFFTRWMDAFHAPFDATQHLISNHALTVDGEDVVYRSYVVANIALKGAPGGDHLSGGGYYTDRVARTGAGWRIRARTVKNLWRTGNVGILDVGKEAVAGLYSTSGS